METDPFFKQLIFQMDFLYLQDDLTVAGLMQIIVVWNSHRQPVKSDRYVYTHFRQVHHSVSFFHLQGTIVSFRHWFMSQTVYEILLFQGSGCHWQCESSAMNSPRNSTNGMWMCVGGNRTCLSVCLREKRECGKKDVFCVRFGESGCGNSSLLRGCR